MTAPERVLRIRDGLHAFHTKIAKEADASRKKITAAS